MAEKTEQRIPEGMMNAAYVAWNKAVEREVPPPLRGELILEAALRWLAESKA